MAVADAAIAVENLSVAYRGKIVLAGLSGCFAAGSLTAVVGPNGAGKSSLLKALAGLLPPQTGRVICPALTAGALAYLPQQADIDRSFPVTVSELVALGAWRAYGAFRAAPAAVMARVRAAAELTGLNGLLSRDIGALSVGEFQRALFARLLLQDASVILLDEPFAAVDEQTTLDLLGVLRRLNAEGRTIVAVLHDLDQVRGLFPQALLLARGAIAWGASADALTAANLARARAALRPPVGANPMAEAAA